MISNTKITAQLYPPFRDYLNQLIAQANALGYRATIVSGYRSMAEQKALFAKGRSWMEQQRQVKKYGKGGAVTDAPPGSSAHNYGLAVDVDGPDRERFVALARSWGFSQPLPDWDPGHIEWPNWRKDFGL